MSQNNKKKRKSDHASESSSVQPKELAIEKKIVVLHKCIKNASVLFAKQGETITREYQNKAWIDLAEDIKGDGIVVGNGIKLKNTVRNWLNRVSKKYDEMNKTGSVNMTPLNDFQQLCLDVLRASTIDVTLENIPDSIEVGRTEEIIFDTTIINSTPITSTKTATATTRNLQETSQPEYQAKRNTTSTDHYSKEIQSLSSIDSERNEREKGEYELRKYSLLLDVIKKETEMNLSPQQISCLRLAVNENLNNLPTAHSIKNIPNETWEVHYMNESGDEIFDT